MERSDDVLDLFRSTRIQQLLDDCAALGSLSLRLIGPRGNELLRAGQLFGTESHHIAIPLPLPARQSIQLVVGAGSRGRPEPLQSAGQAVADLLSNRLTGESELRSLSDEVIAGYEEINLLYDVAASLSTVFDVPAICQTALKIALQATSAPAGGVLLLDPSGQRFSVAAIADLEPTVGEQPLPGTLWELVLPRKRPLLVSQSSDLPPEYAAVWTPAATGPFVPSPLVACPLRARDATLGVLAVSGQPGSREFTARDAKLLAAIAAQTAIALANARLVQSLKASERLRRELEIAAEIQASLLPSQPPIRDWLDLAACCLPAQNVGGDYYDFLAPAADRVGLAIADVSGHSVGSALLMASARATLRARAAWDSSPEETLANLATILYPDLSKADLFLTMFLAQLDRSGRLAYANGGHNRPLLHRMRTGEVIALEADGPPLGIVPSFPYEQRTVHLEPGDLLVLYTDGLTEAANPADELFGEERLCRAVADAGDLPAETVLARLCQAVQAHTAEAPRQDDLTLVVVRWRAG